MERDELRELARRVLHEPRERRGQALRALTEGNDGLRAAVESHLRELESVTIAPGAMSGVAERGQPPSPTPDPGERSIGGYRLIELLGEGGMGVVYLAEQARTKQRVALKLVRAGLASPRVMRRFDAEVQALGRLDHPGVARIFEAGTADTGLGPQPFFAMELVRGVPINEHSESKRSSLHERLVLLVQVCRAVQHAHTKGIIHRDLKPANVLVGEDGRVRVLDFGIARLSESDRGNTLDTQAGQLVGTLPYMSPEQLTADPNAIDTRSDVYALGVMLYELVTGRLPHDLSSRTLAESVKTVTEVPPPAPCTINSRLPGEVGIITLKALERERDRRYQSPADLADDIERYLNNEPILARPPSRVYLMRKFARRHRALVAGAGAVVAALTAGVAGVAWQAVVATGQRDRAVAAEELAERRSREAEKEAATALAINEFLQTMLTTADPEQSQGRAVTVIEVVDAASASVGGGLKDTPLVEGTVRRTLAGTYRSLGSYEKALEHLDRAIVLLIEHTGIESVEALDARRERAGLRAEMSQLEAAEAEAREVLATLERLHGSEADVTILARLEIPRIHAEKGQTAEAVAALRETIPIAQRVLGPDHRSVLTARHNLGTCLKDLGQLEEAEAALRDVLADRRRVQGDSHPETLYSINAVGTTIARRGKSEEAEALFREALATRRSVLGERHPGTIIVKQNIVALITPQGRLDEAEALAREVLDDSFAVFGERHSRTMMAVNSMAYILEDRGRFDEAEPLYRRALDIVESTNGMAHAETFAPLNNLASLLHKRGQLEEAEVKFRDLVSRAEAALTADHYLSAIFKSNYGDCLRELEHYDQAEAQLVRAQETMSAKLGPAHARTVKNAARLVSLYEAKGDAEGVARARAMLPPETK